MNRACAALLLAVASAIAFRAESQESFRLKRAFKLGESDRYRALFVLKGETPMGPAEVEITLETTETTTEVKPDGGATVTTKVEIGKVKFNSFEQQLPSQGSTLTTTFDKDGKVAKQSGGAQGADISKLLAALQPAGPPDRELKVGEEFKFEYQPGGSSSKRVQGRVTVVGKERVVEAELDAIHLKTLLDGPFLEGVADPVHAELDAFVEPSTGKQIKVEGAFSAKQFGPVMEAKVTFKRSRLKPGAKPAN
jgi:hypothetical protein